MKIFLTIMLMLFSFSAHAMDDGAIKKLLDTKSLAKWEKTPVSQRLEAIEWAYNILKKGNADSKESAKNAPELDKCAITEAKKLTELKTNFDMLAIISACYYSLGYNE